MFHKVRAAATLGLLLASDLTGADSAVLADTCKKGRSQSEPANEREPATDRGGIVCTREDICGSSAYAVASTPHSAIEHGELGRLVQAIGARYGGDPTLLRVIIQRESRSNPFADSGKNTLGLMQLLPSTLEQFGVRDPFDPKQNIEAGANCLRFLLDRYANRLSVALAAYNAGESTLDRHGGIPPYSETRGFVSRVVEAYRESGGQVASEDLSQPNVPVRSKRADEECLPVGLRYRRKAW